MTDVDIRSVPQSSCRVVYQEHRQLPALFFFFFAFTCAAFRFFLDKHALALAKLLCLS